MEATDSRRVGAAGGGRQLLSAPADVPVALFLPAESGFQPGPRRGALPVPRPQRAAARSPETSGAPHPHPRTPGRQRAAPAAALRWPASSRAPRSLGEAPARSGASSRGLGVAPSSRLSEGAGLTPLSGRGPCPALPGAPAQCPPKGQMPSPLRPGPRTASPQPPSASSLAATVSGSHPHPPGVHTRLCPSPPPASAGSPRRPFLPRSGCD